MELDVKKAKEILEKLGSKFLPGKGTAVAQAESLMKEKECTLNDKGELVDKDGTVLTSGVSSTTPPKQNQGKLIKIVMKENVLHDGEKYDKGETYEVEEEISEIFEEKQFI